MGKSLILLHKASLIFDKHGESKLINPVVRLPRTIDEYE